MKKTGRLNIVSGTFETQQALTFSNLVEPRAACRVSDTMKKAGFDPIAIQSHWHRLCWQPSEPAPALSADAQRYLCFYRLDFDPHQAGIEHRFGYVDMAGYRIAVHTWRPSSARGTVVVCHGYFDHVGLYHHVIRHLLEQGFAVMAFDLPGHGLSSGEQAAIDDFDVYHQVLDGLVKRMHTLMPTPWHALGQSTGGAIIMSYILRYQHESHFDKVVLLAPLVRPTHWFKARVLHTLVSPFRDYVVRKFQQNSSDVKFLEFLQHHDPLQARGVSARWVGALRKWVAFFEALPEQNQSLIVIQGDLDDTVEWRHNLKVIQQKFRQAKVYVLPGARHQLANESGEFREEIEKIISEYLTASS